MTGTTNLLVYGTLMPGASNHSLIERYVLHAVPGTAQAVLVDLGRFPALIPGNGLVRGVLLTIDSTVLKICDTLEGVPHFYRRNKTTVTLDDGSQIEAWVYEHADPARIADHPTLLVGHENGRPVYAWRLPSRL